MRVELTLRLSLGLLCCIPTAAAVAQNNEPTGDDAIDFGQAIALTLERNPRLIASGYQTDLARARLQQSRLAPNPELKVSVENALGSGPYKGADGMETTISLAWLLERGKRNQRVATAEAGASLAESEREIKRLDVAAETARIFLECVAYENRIQQTSESIALAETSVALVSRRVDAGRSPTADLARADAELSRMNLAREELQHRLLVARHQLAAQWGETTPGFVTVSANIRKLPTVQSYDQLLLQIKESPDQLRFLTERRLREAELRQAESNARSSWRLSAGVRRFELSDDHAFVAELSIPLAFRNKNQGRVAEARYALELTSAEQSASVLQIETRLFALYQDLLHSLHRANALNNDILPKVEGALDATERAYAAGRYSFYELSAARRDLLTARSSAIEAAIDTLRSIVEIERLAGVSVTSSIGRTGGAS